MCILIRKVSIKFFYKYCKVCPHFKENNNKHKYYCYLNKTKKWFLNGWKKRIIFGDFKLKIYNCIKCNKYDRICQKIHYWEDKKSNLHYNDFAQGFSDCMNGLPVQKNNKDYIEGYSKAMLLKKDCDGKKFINNVLANNNNNSGLTNSNATTSSSTTIIT